ncbi:MAG TPA: PAS domain S-box protein [Candidatus Binatia bacterium]|jgi:PAS domain S-box-containing protein
MTAIPHPAPGPIPELNYAARALVAERLGTFAASWLGPMVIWALTLTFGSPRAPFAAWATIGVQVAALRAALRLRDRHPDGIYAIVLGLAMVLALSSIVLFAWARGTAEVLGFVLFTLCSLCALLFPWGGRVEFALTATVLAIFALAFPRLHFALPPSEVVPVVTVAAALCVAFAEGNARAFRAATLRTFSEEAALRELAASRDSYRDLTEHASDFIWATDPEGRMTYVNAAGAHILGGTQESLLGRKFDTYLTDHPANPDLAALRRRITSGEKVPASLSQIRTVRGPMWIETVRYPIHGANGDVLGFRGISRDVTERWEAEAALRESEARYRGLIESQEELIFRADFDGSLTFINEACRRKYGVDQRAEGVSFLDFVHPDDAPFAGAALRGLAAGGRYRRTSRGQTPEGWRWVEWEVCAIADEAGAITEIQGVGHDVSERRAADEALQASLAALREREEQLRLMARRQAAVREDERKRLSFDLHDGVCQELVGIGILVESARSRGVSEGADPKLVQVQGHLRQVGEHIRMLARDLRPLQLSDLGLGECLRALAKGMATEAVSVTVSFPAALPRLAEETEVAVYRVAQEALANAVRHAAPRAVTLTLGAERDWLRLEVRDDGRGFDRTTLGSAALGLVAMEERAIALGGRLAIRSAPGAGTTVCLECPLGAS